MRLAFASGLVALVAVLVVLTSAASVTAAAAPGAAGGGLPAALHPAGVPAVTPSSSGSARPSGANCTQAWTSFTSWYGGAVPIAVRAALQSSCPLEPDQASLSFLSNGTDSGARVQFTIDLPAATASPASATAGFGIGMWVAGVPCSYDGAAYLNVELLPPYQTGGANASANWTVWAPVDDLVPAASCDPQCQNTTALYTLDGTPYCEDDVVVHGVGSRALGATGAFAPGDALTATIVGTVGGTSGITVYLNDSSHPRQDLSWAYGASLTADHRSLTPLASASGWSPSAWGYGAGVAATVQNCPTRAGDGPATCTSYDGPAWRAVSLPTIVAADYWNDTSLTYSNAYDWAATASSTGACGATRCEDFTSFGGTGAYPFWSLTGTGGVAGWSYGLGGATALATWGGAGQFDPTGGPTYFPTPILASLTPSVIGNTVYLDTVAGDVVGVSAVQFGAYFCFGSATPSVATASGTLTISLVDSAQDGNWTGSFSTGSYLGTVHLWARAQSTTGAWSPPLYGQATATGVTTCSFPAPAPPTFTSLNVTAVGGGFSLNWTDTSPAIAGYTVEVNQTNGPARFVVPLGNVSHAFLVLGLTTSTTYNLTVVAEDVAGRSAAATVTDQMPWSPMLATLSGPTQPMWVNGGSASFTSQAFGGVGPDTYVVSFGDGTTLTTVAANGSQPFSHNYGSYFGTAVASETVTDSLGETVRSNAVLVTVLATPLAVPQSISAGAVEANVSWFLSPSPAGVVEGYTIFSTTDAAAAPTMTAAIDGGPAAANVTVSTTDHLWQDLYLPTGATLWAVVIAWDGYGNGSLPASGAPLVATTANLTAGPIESTPAGGPAPFTAALSDFVTNGTNDAITQASYASGFNNSGTPTVTPGFGGVWINGTLVLGSPGTHLVVLHVTDAFADFALQLGDIYVAPGGPLTVQLSPPGPAGWTGWAGTPLTFRAQVLTGPGPDAFDWSFGDGDVGTGANATHTYPFAGNYTLTVTATDNTTGGAGSLSQTVEVFAPPWVAISTAPGVGPLAWVFTAITGGGSGTPFIVWSFGDGSTQSGMASVTHAYATPGVYSVNVSSTDPTGKGATSTYLLTITGEGSSGGSGGGTYLGQSAGTWGGVALGLAALVVVLVLAAFLLRRRGREGGSATALERWRSGDEGAREGKRDRP